MLTWFLLCCLYKLNHLKLHKKFLLHSNELIETLKYLFDSSQWSFDLEHRDIGGQSSESTRVRGSHVVVCRYPWDSVIVRCGDGRHVPRGRILVVLRGVEVMEWVGWGLRGVVKVNPSTLEVIGTITWGKRRNGT